MTYDPRTYWPNRYRGQGKNYVAKNGSPASYQAQLEAITPMFDILPTEGRVLDYGCGPERFRPALEAHGLDYEGVDLIPELGTMDAADIEPGSFDAAVCVFVLQHIADEAEYERVLDTITEALAPGGMLVVIDHDEREGMAAHMHPRGPQPIMERMEGEVASFDADHWVGWFTK